MTPLEILRAARKRIEAPERWTKGAGARFADGTIASPNRVSEAVSFCCIGALLDGDQRANTEAYVAMASVVPGGLLAPFNDAPSTSHSDVLAAFDRAIARLEAQMPGRK